MITVIRERLHGSKLYKYIMWLLIITMALLWTIPTLRRMGGGSWVALVNGQEVSYGDFARKMQLYALLVEQFKQQYGEQADMLLAAMGMNQNPAIMAIHEMIRETLLNQAAQSSGLHLDEEYIRQMLNDHAFVQQALPDLVPAYVFDKSGNLNREQFAAYLKYVGISMKEFETKLEQALARYLVLELLAVGTYAPSFEVKKIYNDNYLAKDFAVVEFSREHALNEIKKKGVSPEQLQSYYNQQSALQRYWVPEKRTGVVWKFDPKSYGISVDASTIQNYYEDQKTSEFLEKPGQIEVRTIVFAINEKTGNEKDVYKNAQAVRDQLVKDPSLFAQKAKELSQDISAKNGGLLAPFAKGTQEQAFDKAAFLLKNDNDISEVVRTKKGFEIIQRVRKTQPQFKTLNQVEQSIKNTLTNRSFVDQFSQAVQQIIDQPTVNKTTLDLFVKEHGGVAQNITNVAQQPDKVIEQLYSIEKSGSIRFFVDNGVGYIVQLNKVDQRSLPDLEAIADVVKEDIYQEQADNALQEMAQHALEEASTVSLSALSKKYDARLFNTGMIKKEDTAKLKSLREQGLPVERMVQMEKSGQVALLKQGTKQFIVAVTQVEPFKPEAFGAKKQELAKAVLQERIGTVGEGFVASLYRTATIKINESLLIGGEHQLPTQDFQYYED